MYYLIYSSYAHHSFNDEELRSLLITSQQKNVKYGITGMMYYFSGQFLQLIEGAEDNVKQLYSNICADKRHGKVITLNEGVSENRYFAEWSMGFKAISPQELADVEGYRDLNTPGGPNTMAVLKLLRMF